MKLKHGCFEQTTEMFSLSIFSLFVFLFFFFQKSLNDCYAKYT